MCACMCARANILGVVFICLLVWFLFSFLLFPVLAHEVCRHVWMCAHVCMGVCICMCVCVHAQCACIEMEVQSWYYVSSSETGSPDDLGVHQFWLF